MKKILILLCVLLLVGCSSNKVVSKQDQYPGSKLIELNGDSATIDGVAINEYDYTWHCDPTEVHDDVDNAPAEYYTGTPNTEDTIYIDHELFYYPEIDEDKFVLVNYDGENEWAYYYEDGENNDYIFSTLPNFMGSFPSQMMHSEEEASENKVLHITEAGTYIIQGSFNGQIKFDLGDDSFTDEEAKITVVLNGVDINCSVAPGIIFENAYEVDNAWEENEEHSSDVDLSECGVEIIVADDTTNTVSGQNIFRMLKTKYKDDESTDEIKVQKKIRKYDAPFYSCVSMKITGETNNTGTLEINSNFEGLDSELHMIIDGANVTINSDDDGINVNEDNVSVFVMNSGNLTINAANGAEGDGIDSNGYVVINGGNLNINNVVAPDNAIDTEDGLIYNAGTITIDGEVYEIEVGTYKEISSTNQGFGPGGGGQMPNGEFDPNNMPGGGEKPDGNFDPNNMPDDFNPDDLPDDYDPDNMPGGGEKPDGNFDPNSKQENQTN